MVCLVGEVVAVTIKATDMTIEVTRKDRIGQERNAVGGSLAMHCDESRTVSSI